jgi:putative inorganic carbon (HCO3(-)) transporter
VIYDAYVLPKLLLARLLVLVLLGLEIARCVLRGRIQLRRTAVDLPLLAFVGSAALSSLLAVNRNVAVFGTYTRDEGLLTIATYALLFWLASQVLTDRHEARALTRSLLASGYVVAVFAVLQAVIATVTAKGHAGETSLSFAGMIRPTSTLGNANELAIVLAMLLPLCVYEILSARSFWGRLIGSNVALVLGLALMLTFSRSAWLAATAGVVVVLAWRAPVRPRVLAVVGLSALLIVVAIIAAGAAGAPIFHAVVARLASLGSPGSGSAGSRLHIWGDTLHLIAARPVAGWGPDSFGLVFPHYATANWTPGIPIDEAHAELLQVTATRGVVGAAAYLWILGAFAVAFWRGRRLDGSIAMLGALLAYQLALQVNFSWVPAAFPFWLLAAAAMATWSPSTPEPDRAVERGRAVTRWPLAVLVVAAGVAAGTAAVAGPLAADGAYFTALAAQQRGDLSDARTNIGHAQSDGPHESAYAVRAGDLALDLVAGDAPGPRADWSAAVAAYETAARLGTAQPSAYRHLAVADWALGRRPEAVAAAREAVSLGPFDPANRALLDMYLTAVR